MPIVDCGPVAGSDQSLGTRPRSARGILRPGNGRRSWGAVPDPGRVSGARFRSAAANESQVSTPRAAHGEYRRDDLQGIQRSDLGGPLPTRLRGSLCVWGSSCRGPDDLGTFTVSLRLPIVPFPMHGAAPAGVGRAWRRLTGMSELAGDKGRWLALSW